MQCYRSEKKKSVWKQKNFTKMEGWPQNPPQKELLIPQNTWTCRVILCEPILIPWDFFPSLNYRFLDSWLLPISHWLTSNQKCQEARGDHAAEMDTGNCALWSNFSFLLMQKPHKRWCPKTSKHLARNFFYDSRIDVGGTQTRSSGAHVTLNPLDCTQLTFLVIPVNGVWLY